ncbi:MAG: XdhC family protein [Hyphomicrobiaceae bacterium]
MTDPHRTLQPTPSTAELAATPAAPATPLNGRFVDPVIPQLAHWQAEGISSALVTLVAVDGSSPRPVGSQIAVNVHGDAVGTITSGCAEATLVAEALAAIEKATRKVERYGKGSRYMDVRLPCGSGIDVLIDGHPDRDMVARVADAIVRRQPVSWTIPLPDAAVVVPPDVAALDVVGPTEADLPRSALDPEARWFKRVYLPSLAVSIAGRGPAVRALAEVAAAMAWPVHVASPDQPLLEALRPQAQSCSHLTRPSDFDASHVDPWTAVVLLFHDHDWEPELLERVLNSRAFYVGALGSLQTQAQRRAILAARGVSAGAIDMVRGPIGLDIGAENPVEIALSTAAEIVAAARVRRLTSPTVRPGEDMAGARWPGHRAAR